MGINNSTEKITIDQKLQCIDNRIIKYCSLHHQEATIFCSLPNCKKSPYLCQQCMAVNVHPHQQGLYKHNQFIKSIVDLIELKKAEDNKMLFTSIKQEKDYANTIKQQMKIMEYLDAILLQVTNKLTEFKRKLQAMIDNTMKKANRAPNSTKSESYYRLYSNPNILVNKIISDNTDQFVLTLKEKLDIISKTRKGLTDEDQLQQMKAEFDGIKSSLREMFNISNAAYFAKKSNSTSAGSLVDPKAIFKKSMVLPDQPFRVFNGAYSIFSCTKKQLYQIEPFERQKSKIHNQSVLKLTSNNIQSGEFIALTGPHSVLYWTGKEIQKINIATKITSINILKGRKNVYGLLGEEQGIFNVIDLKENKSVFHYRCGQKPLLFIQICQANSTIYCGSMTGNIFMFKSINKFDQYDFDYLGQLPSTLLPQGQLQIMKIKNYDMYLMGTHRNIVLYDLMLNTEIIRTQYNRRAPPFVDAILYNSNPNHKNQQILITLNENQVVLYSWTIDRSRRTVKVDPIILPNRQNKLEEIPILSITSFKHELWALKDNLKELHAFMLQL